MKTMATLLVMLALTVSVSFGQKVINDFDTMPEDTTYWRYENNENADPDLAFIELGTTETFVHEGDGALQMNWSVHNAESWGGYSKIDHWRPDSNSVYDFSGDSLVLWYYNDLPASLEERMVFRINLIDVSDSENGANTYSVVEAEYWYSFHYILDTADGWTKISIPLVDARKDPNLDEWNGEGFNLTGWTGIAGNDSLDLDQIKGFTFEYSISGAGEGDFADGVLIVDNMYIAGAPATNVTDAEPVRGFNLEQNYPNPFNPTTTIEFNLNQTEPVTLEVYDLLGNRVKTLVNEQLSAGQHSIQMDATDVASGVYLYQLVTPSFKEMKKMTVIK